MNSEQKLNDLPNKTLFRPGEVAKFFGVSRATIYRWVEFGLLEGCKPTEGSLRIFRNSVIALLEK